MRNQGKWLGLLVWALLLTVPAHAGDGNNGVQYYVSVGDSLSVGVQPIPGAGQVETDEGYADQLFDAIESDFGKIRLVKLGCPAETTTSMITGSGSRCTYDEGSQLAQLLQFLHAHKDKVALVTINIGVNDLLQSGCIVGTDIDPVCLQAEVMAVGGRTAQIAYQLRQAAHPDTKIIGMNYYNTFLASWFTNPELAHFSAVLANGFNDALAFAYGAAAIPVADVADKFASSDFETMVDFGGGFLVPLNVALICQWTHMCTAGDIHANQFGYGMIAMAFLEHLYP